jgi:hypothetical protein
VSVVQVDGGLRCCAETEEGESRKRRANYDWTGLGRPISDLKLCPGFWVEVVRHFKLAAVPKSHKRPNPHGGICSDACILNSLNMDLINGARSQ